jgi:hypothetical protein
MRCWSNVHAARTPNDATIRRAAASFVQTDAPVQVGTRTKHSCRLHAVALDSIGAVEYDAEARSISLPLTVALTASGPIGAVGTRTKHSCRLRAVALDSIGAVEYNTEARSISLPSTVALTASGPIGANISSVVLLDRLRSAFRLPRSLIIGERGFMPDCGARSPSMYRLDRERSGAACRARCD